MNTHEEKEQEVEMKTKSREDAWAKPIEKLKKVEDLPAADVAKNI